MRRGLLPRLQYALDKILSDTGKKVAVGVKVARLLLVSADTSAHTEKLQLARGSIAQ